jgi:hypothetical protein
LKGQEAVQHCLVALATTEYRPIHVSLMRHSSFFSLATGFEKPA